MQDYNHSMVVEIYSLAVKKGAALFKMASVKKLWNQRGGQEMAVMVYSLMAKILITTIQVNLCCLIPASPGLSTKFTWIVVIKFLPSTYTTTAISSRRKHPDRLADSCKRSSVNRMAAHSRLQVQVMDFFLFHLLFKHALYSQVKGFRPHGLLVYRLCLPPDTPIIFGCLLWFHDFFTLLADVYKVYQIWLNC